MLFYTNIELDLLSDIDMYQMVEKGIWGGLAQCSLRHAKANNKHLSNYDAQDSESFLVHLDCVNLYGHAMMQKLPTGNFRFLNEKEVNQFDVLSIPVDADIGIFWR